MRKILCTTCTTKHMYHNAPHMYHMNHNTCMCTTKHLYVPGKILCTTCTTKDHHAPPKNKIYLVGLPSTLSERPCQCDRNHLKQLILRISCEIRKNPQMWAWWSSIGLSKNERPINYRKTCLWVVFMAWFFFLQKPWKNIEIFDYKLWATSEVKWPKFGPGSSHEK